MSYINGKIRNMIFESESGYKVGLFRIKETDDEDLFDYLNKTITFTGTFGELNTEDSYTLNGEYINHDRYGFQFVVASYEKMIPKGHDAVVEFLSSSLIKGCGEKTALKIVETLGEDAIKKIKENKNNLLLVPGINEDKATKIYNSILKYSESDDLIIYLKGLGFTNKESLDIINYANEETKKIIEKDIYTLNEIIDFKKLDTVYLTFGNPADKIRVKACLIESMKHLAFSSGDTYHTLEEIYSNLKMEYRIFLEEDEFLNYIAVLINENKIIKLSDKYFLKEYYNMEHDIANSLKDINRHMSLRFEQFDSKIKALEERIGVKYNKEQKEAIKSALNNNITVITGGPGTGKTTIINAIVQLYIINRKLDNIEILKDIALLAPTGRASRKMSESTLLPAGTIHRYLKWNKETNSFAVNEFNKQNPKLVIVDEVSMIDTYIMDSLLKGLNSYIKLILVGDPNQLPSVGPGLILKDIIDSNAFTHCPLVNIYRQSDNSYIPYLCREIKEHNISESFMEQKDDYNFIEAGSHQIKDAIKRICEMSLTKNLSVNDIQILAPMYKGENGIDNLNKVLQELFNPEDNIKREIKYGDYIYREKDKVLQLVNDPDSNIFNGDIGYIRSIEKHNNKDSIIIDFDGNKVIYKKEDLHMIKHAYVISIHKSQGSEFNNVIIPLSKEYNRMLYNKLIYTGISRAKKSLVLIGNREMFLTAVNNDYSKNRKTNLLSWLIE